MLREFHILFLQTFKPNVEDEEEEFYAIGASGESDGEIVDERLIPFSVFEGETEVADMVRKL